MAVQALLIFDDARAVEVSSAELTKENQGDEDASWAKNQRQVKARAT
ncbi:MAG: hypothetical protein H0X73_11385 [Chthoniobacterales bacterium]|nr:hypothetical protein [Chthoniobacterales bacterium]